MGWTRKGEFEGLKMHSEGVRDVYFKSRLMLCGGGRYPDEAWLCFG